MSAYVHTLGDSTLDNLYWLLNTDGTNHDEAKKTSVEGKLAEKLNKGSSTPYEVVSHAYDGFTTQSVLNGDNVGRMLEWGRPKLSSKKAVYLKNKDIDNSNSNIKPLEKLKSFIEGKGESTHYVVISVGGNDFRERLHNPIALLLEIPYVHHRYLKILNEVKKLKNVKPILMFQYQLDARSDVYLIYTVLKVVGIAFMVMQALGFLGLGYSAVALIASRIDARAALIWGLISAAAIAVSHLLIPMKFTIDVVRNRKEIGLATLGVLMERFYRPILEIAKKGGIPILDLPNTFYPYNSDLYINQIEPSPKGSILIAEGIDHIIKSDPFNEESRLYFKQEGHNVYTATRNSGRSWVVNYPTKANKV